tara:strand:- start:3389 stop:4354 length:966 start_codon:yes stop_codon:yes gene_type:complete
MKCSGCKKEKTTDCFTNGDKTYKKCITCREKAREWRETNKERVSLYNKMYGDKNKKQEETKVVVLAKKITEETWVEYKSQADAAKSLNLFTSNINKVLKGNLKTTGGYEFKTENKENNDTEYIVPSWDQIKKDNDFGDKVKDQPSKQRILHETVDDVIGKKCCKCKEWKPLTNYNNDSSHWDKLRNECKDCLVIWRKNNVKEISRKYKIYEKNRKLIDPEFKLLKTLRSRLGSALKRKNIEKGFSTMDLTGCQLSFLRGYIEAKFTEGMTWEKVGKEIHIDHIKPCCSFDLTKEEEQKKCFHYSNLQPLWARDNLVKGGKI